MNKKWEQFIFSIIAHLTLPLLPLIVEKLLTGSVANETWAITAAMYTIAIGVSSNWLPILGVSLLVSMISVCSFGFLKAGTTANFDVPTSSLIAIIAFFIVHTIERYMRHVNDGEIFLGVGVEKDV
ncbi:MULTISPECIES: hypothetical protein [unclassified Halomonas]|uniref:hypothetical protein n=1 Tax=unclassified Halomonas TaxID=2609666 RepID=UPI0007E0825D|nr:MULTISPECIES: hypothetical protein [unclassified Halomonas]MBT2784978.1 hypothetical protein [Halomonas sp. ISL-106]MBT2796672.1 hypothetical protein [Halomonas sp. ISL-104]OAL59904.1 hypothetical protein A6R74_01145 [Halomonas sp. ALS9]